MLKIEIEEEEMLVSLRDAIGALPDSRAFLLDHDRREHPGRYAADGLLDVTVRGRNMRLVVDVRRDLFPRDIRHIVWQLRDYLAGLPGGGEQIPMLIGRTISEGARKILRTENVGYYDLGGSLFIPAESVYILVDRPRLKKAGRVLGSIFQGQRARVVQALVEIWPAKVGVKELVERTGVSPATASETLTEMERREWLEVEGAGPSKMRRLRERGLVLDEWTRLLADQKPPRLERFYVPLPDTRTMAERLAVVCKLANVAYAVTGEFAGQAYAPYLTGVSQLRCRVEPGRGREQVLMLLDARPVNEGWNLGLLETRTRSDIVVGEHIDGVAYAPPVQVYLDLLQGSGRAKEMAAHLRSERLAG